MPELDPSEELKHAFEKVLASKSAKRLIVAGPGAGKTTLFQKLLERTSGDKNDRIALTFINDLKDDLEKSLGGLAHVYTLHGYCHYLLRVQPELRQGLSDDFEYFPGLEDLIIRDWELTAKKPSPKFIGMMRDLSSGPEVDFYMGRSDYYDAVSYDDSVYRTYMNLNQGADSVAEYELILVDEYQDFNQLESSFIELLADKSPIVIAGDDDQALYSQLRSSRQEFIRNLNLSGEYEVFALPFCMRCPKAVVEAVKAILAQVEKRGFLKGRIKKPFRYFAPSKGADSEKYPYIQIAECSTQMLKANYFGRYIAQEIRKIPAHEIAESHDRDYPTVLVIGSRQYLCQIDAYLKEQGFAVIQKADSQSKFSRENGIRILKKDPESNLGWRIIVESDKPTFEKKVVTDSVDTAAPMHTLLPNEFKARILQGRSSIQRFQLTLYRSNRREARQE